MRVLAALVLAALVLAAPVFAASDLILDPNYTASTMTQETWTFLAGECAVQEGAVTAGPHRLLVFGAETVNIGTSDMVVGPPKRNDPVNWEYSACHDHWHFKNYAQWSLYDVNGMQVASGLKEGFCIEDTNPYLSSADPRPKYTCRRQGIQAGWADTYGWGLIGQWLVIDGVPSGQYTLVATVNPAGYLPESDYSNNTIWVPVSIL